jgi:hypothetical protein
MNKNTTRLELIESFEQIKAELIDAASHGRPVCPVLSGDLMALAEKLSATEKTQDFIRELEDKQKHQPPGPFSGVTGF